MLHKLRLCADAGLLQVSVPLLRNSFHMAASEMSSRFQSSGCAEDHKKNSALPAASVAEPATDVVYTTCGCARMLCCCR